MIELKGTAGLKKALKATGQSKKYKQALEWIQEAKEEKEKHEDVYVLCAPKLGKQEAEFAIYRNSVERPKNWRSEGFNKEQWEVATNNARLRTHMKVLETAKYAVCAVSRTKDYALYEIKKAPKKSAKKKTTKKATKKKTAKKKVGPKKK